MFDHLDEIEEIEKTDDLSVLGLDDEKEFDFICPSEDRFFIRGDESGSLFDNY